MRSPDKLEVHTHGTRDECYEHCKLNLNCYQAEWYPKLEADDIDHPICYLFPVGSRRMEGYYHWATIRREVRGSSIIRCKEKQCHQNAKSDDWNGCRPGQRGAFCALSDEKISWPLSSNEFNQISRCKQCPKIGPKRRRVHNSIEWGKPKNCLQVRVFDITNAYAVILAYFCQTQIRKRSW